MNSKELEINTEYTDGWYWWKELPEDDWEVIQIKEGLMYERILANTQGDWVLEPTSYLRGFFRGPIDPPVSIE